MKLNFLKRFEFFAGVPDSQLRPLCDYLIENYGVDGKRHVICANEGNCVATAAGYYLVTGKIPLVYMQNSGEGNIINPVASLLNDKVYGIPMVFVIGWRGEPGVHDEPQHIFQGEVTLKLLEDMGISYFVIDKSISEEEVEKQLDDWQSVLVEGKQVAFVVKKGALEFDGKVTYKNGYSLKREEAIKRIIRFTGTDPVISTTGKASRELFEAREEDGEGHGFDFLTVGSMGHSSSIAFGVAEALPQKKVWCIDGDGAALMHMGAMAVIGAYKPKNLVHIVIDNGAHETVGGMPTVAGKIDLKKIAEGCGYPKVVFADSEKDLDKALLAAKNANELTLIVVKCAIGARDNLGRPTTTAKDNKKAFMQTIGSLG